MLIATPVAAAVVALVDGEVVAAAAVPVELELELELVLPHPAAANAATTSAAIPPRPNLDLLLLAIISLRLSLSPDPFVGLVMEKDPAGRRILPGAGSASTRCRGTSVASDERL